MLRWFSTLFAIMIFTAIAGELKITPFLGFFRFSLGSAVFFFLILWLKPKYLPLIGLLTGIFVSLFRLALDYFSGLEVNWVYFVSHHGPSIFYYVSFTLLLHWVQYRKWLKMPIIFGAISGLVDFGSNFIELILRGTWEGSGLHLWSNTPVLLLIGLIRTYLVVGFYTMIEYRQLEAVSKEQKSRMEKLLFIATELHEESLYLQKMMKNVEEITAKSYKLSQQLARHPLGMDLLRMAEEIHEVKKDSQRIQAGISSLVRQEATEGFMLIGDVVNLVVQSNTKYASHLGKVIKFKSNCWESWRTTHYYSILSLLNNIVSNSVEAIIYEGVIEIQIYRKKNLLIIQIQDDGPGIQPQDRELIFKPGFTSKYDPEGNPSTGIGLSHVVTILNDLSGSVRVSDSDSGGALFQITLPVDVIVHREQ